MMHRPPVPEYLELETRSEGFLCDKQCHRRSLCERIKGETIAGFNFIRNNITVRKLMTATDGYGDINLSALSHHVFRVYWN
jgi:hypothetical protein